MSNYKKKKKRRENWGWRLKMIKSAHQITLRVEHELHPSGLVPRKVHALNHKEEKTTFVVVQLVRMAYKGIFVSIHIPIWQIPVVWYGINSLELKTPSILINGTNWLCLSQSKTCFLSILCGLGHFVSCQPNY